MKIERSVEIQRPIEEVFAFVRDPDNDPIWCPTVSESKRVHGQGPEVGAVYQQVHRPGPAAPTGLRVELLEVDPPHLLRMRTTDDLAVFDVWYRLERLDDDRTLLTQTDDARFQGAAKLLQPVMWFAIRGGIGRQFRELKRRLERESSREASVAG